MWWPTSRVVRLGADPDSGGSRIRLQAPQRVLDVRRREPHRAVGKVGQAEVIDLAVAAPGSGVTGVVLNLTGTEPTSSTYVTAFPGDAPLSPPPPT